MLLLIWPVVLFAVRINANEGPCSTQIKEQTATLTCTDPAKQEPWSCTNGHEKHIGEDKVGSTVTINLLAEQNGTNFTCRVNLTGTILTKKPVTLNLTSKSDLKNCTRNETQPTSNSTAQHPNTTPSNSDGETSGTAYSMKEFLETVKQPKVICAFLMGFLLATLVSTVVCCLMRKSHRKKMKIYGNLSEALEMTSDPEGAAGPGASAAGHSDVDYSTIKFSAVKRAKLEETTETEYAEIKREETAQEEDGEGSQEEGAIMGEVEVEVEAESGGMMEDEDAALCPDVEVGGSEMEAFSA